jgi:hypothetical protein
MMADLFYDLIYAGPDVEALIKEHWPNAKITDASDEIHRERFELSLDATEDDFYRFAIEKGFALECLCFQLMLRDPCHREGKDKIRKWIKEVKGVDIPMISEKEE